MNQFEGYSLDIDGLLQFRGRIYVPKDSGLRRLVMDESHRSPYSAHPGVKKMYETLKNVFFWPRMKKEMAKYVAHCLECQQVKAEHHHPAGLL